MTATVWKMLPAGSCFLGSQSDDVLGCDNPLGALESLLDDLDEPLTKDTVVTLACGGPMSIDEHGKPIECESGDGFELDWTAQIEVNIYDFCEANDCLNWLGDVP